MDTNSPVDHPPTPRDAARRLVILHHVTLAPLALLTRSSRLGLQNAPAEKRDELLTFLNQQRDAFWSKLREQGLWEFLSPSELELSKANGATMTDRQIVNASWRAEAAHTLAWALGLRPEIAPYDTQVRPWQLPVDTDIRSFIAQATLRDRDEIEKARSIAELWHWRSRTRQLIESGTPLTPTRQLTDAGLHSFDDIVRLTAKHAFANGDLPQPIDEDFPANSKAYRDLTDEEWSDIRSITIERHFGLNWLCGHAPNNEWDETETST